MLHGTRSAMESSSLSEMKSGTSTPDGTSLTRKRGSYSGGSPDMENKKVFLLLFVLVTFVSGCAFCPRVDPKYKLIMKLDDYMIPLAKAVDIVVDELPPEAKDQEILLAAVKRSGNPGLLRPFEGYVLRARMENGVGG